MTALRVSIVLPAYNAASFLADAVKSVQAQTEGGFELLVVDDCSSDGTAALVERLGADDGRIRLIRMAQNGGPAAARNAGFAAAAGEWIALLDADDAYRPERLATLLALGEATGADLVADNLVMRSEAGNSVLIETELLPVARQVSAAEFIDRNIGTPGSRTTWGLIHPMFRRVFLTRHGLRYEARNRFGEDYMLYVACLRAGGRLWVTPQAMYEYTVRAGSLTDVQSAADLYRITALEADYLTDPATAENPSLQDALRRHVAKVRQLYAYRAFTDALKQGSPGKAARVLGEHRAHPGYIAREVMRQAPLIAGKALRGGYLRS